MATRAYARMTVRAVNEDARTFEGWATTPTTDRLGDVIDPLGAKFKNPLALLHQHNSDAPIGNVRLSKATKEGIAFVATIPRIDQPGPLKDRVDTAWGEIKAGLVRAVSIGFRPLKDGMEALKDGSGWLFSAIEILELSTVSVPANPDATITQIRNFDLASRAATGRVVSVGTRPRDGGQPQPRDGGGLPSTRLAKGDPIMKTTSEQITDFTTTRTNKAARMASIMEAAGERGETLNGDETEEYDGLAADLKSIDNHLVRLRDLEAAQARTVEPVRTLALAGAGAGAGAIAPIDHGGAGGGESRAGRIEPVVRSAEHVEPGIRMARVAKSIILARMGGRDPIVVAQEHYGNDALVVATVRAAIGAGTLTDPTWAGALVGHAGSVYADFAAFLRPMTILGQFGQGGIPDLRRVPFRMPLIGQTSGGKGYWVGEGKAKPLTKFDFARTVLEPLKVAAIAVLTKEIIRSSNPQADIIVRDSLVDALRERLDIDFVDPAKAAVAGVSPASITNGVVGIPSSGVDADAVRADIKAAYAAYTAGNNTLGGGVWIMNANTAASIGMMRTLVGVPEFTGIDRSGGNLAGFPIVASDYVPASEVILVNAKEIYLGDEGGFEVDMSAEASLEMSDAPIGDSGAPTGAATMVSLWQTNSVGLLAEREINWAKRRPEAVVVITGVDWGNIVGP